MKNIETADIALIMSSITAIAAVIIPVISTVISLKHNEKVKQTELHSPKVYNAVNQLVTAYTNLMRYADQDFINSNNSTSEENKRAHVENHKLSYGKFKVFKAACYDIITLIPNSEIQDDLLTYLSELENRGYRPEHLDTDNFHSILAKISLVISPATSKKRQRKRTKK